MTKLPALLTVIFLCIGVHYVQAQSFTFSIASPAVNSVSDSVLNINVRYYTSTYELARITAATEGRMDTLSNAGNGGGYINFNGSINIAGLAQGNTYQLKVTCRDVLGNTKTDSVNYIYVKPPVPNIVSPINGAGIWPTLHIITSHTGFDTCISKVTVSIASQQVFNYTSILNDIDTSIRLSNALSGTGLIALTVTDKWGQSVTTYTQIIADNYHSYPYLTPVYTGAGKILDYNYNKLLEARGSSLYIVDSGFQTSTRIPSTNTISASSTGKLTPYGAVWDRYEWNNGILRTHTYSSYAGKYAIYSALWHDTLTGMSGYNLYRRDLGTRTDIEIYHEYDPSSFESTKVDPRGSVIFYNGDNSALGRYKVNGGTNYIATANPPYGFSEVTLYGDTVLYSITYYENPSSTKIYLDNGTSSSLLSNLPYGFYKNKVSGKYIAYSKPGTTGQTQVWLRDSTGNSVQKTFFGTDSYLIGLNEHGDLLFNNSNKCYYLKKDSINPKEIGAALESPFYKDGVWYVIKDNSLYKININAYRTIAAGNWSNPASWQNGIVPPPGADIIVTSNILVDADITCNTLNVVPPGSITVLPGVNLTVLH